ncbi:MAG TPA: MerR family DNA-binding transcriptional regulator [Streptosporangiaceae bacterium]|nr:MerR family DNA-binding transcriptional regulator [Streptosporangiaceae bacterium]
MRITEAASRLGISARMLRYRETLGLLPAVRGRAGRRAQPASAASAGTAPARLTGGQGARPVPGPGVGTASGPGVGTASGPGARAPGTAVAAHRQFTDADLDAVAIGLAIERRYDISPAALAFGLRVLADPAARSDVAELGRLIGRIRPLPAMAMDFEKERALRLLGTASDAQTGPHPRSSPHPRSIPPRAEPRPR